MQGPGFSAHPMVSFVMDYCLKLNLDFLLINTVKQDIITPASMILILED